MNAVLGFLNNPLVLTIVTVLVGLITTYNPKLKKIPNEAISFLNAILAFTVKVAGSSVVAATAQPAAWTAAFAPAAYVAAAHGSAVTLAGHALDAGWQAVVSYLVFKVFRRCCASTHA